MVNFVKKNPTAKGKTQKKRRRLKQDSESESESETVVLKELKLEQKLRHHKILKSFDASEKPKTQEDENPSSETQETEFLDGQFTGQSAEHDIDIHQKLRNKYVEKKLKSKGKQSINEEQEDASINQESQLFQSSSQKAKVKKHAKDEQNGAILSWHTGIAEVDLPQQYVEKNISATKRALEQQHQQQSESAPPLSIASSALPTNFSTNFQQHRKDFVHKLQNATKEQQKQKGFKPVGKDQPSDDVAVRNFQIHQRKNRLR